MYAFICISHICPAQGFDVAIVTIPTGYRGSKDQATQPLSWLHQALPNGLRWSQKKSEIHYHWFIEGLFWEYHGDIKRVIIIVIIVISSSSQSSLLSSSSSSSFSRRAVLFAGALTQVRCTVDLLIFFRHCPWAMQPRSPVMTTWEADWKPWIDDDFRCFTNDWTIQNGDVPFIFKVFNLEARDCRVKPSWPWIPRPMLHGTPENFRSQWRLMEKIERMMNCPAMFDDPRAPSIYSLLAKAQHRIILKFLKSHELILRNVFFSPARVSPEPIERHVDIGTCKSHRFHPSKVGRWRKASQLHGSSSIPTPSWKICSSIGMMISNPLC